MGEDRPRRRAEGGDLSGQGDRPARSGGEGCACRPVRPPEAADASPAAADPARAPDDGVRRNFYGRRRGKTLRARQRDLLGAALRARAVPGVAPADNPARLPIDPAALFPGASDLWLEIGFGGGEHLIAVAESHPRIGLIGCEPFMNGVAMCLAALDGRDLPNLRLHAGDARDLLDVLPTASLGRVYLLYPDPWPKRRHIERRFFSPGNLDALARALRPGGELRLATDVPAYVEHARRVATDRADFACSTPPQAQGAPWAGWPGTRYEAKALREGRAPAYLRFVRLP